MAIEKTQLQLRRGTTSESNAFTGAEGEPTVDTDKKTIVVHDGSTAGGTVLATEDYVDSLIPSVPVTSIIAGTNISIDPTGGIGNVTINASGGGGGGKTYIELLPGSAKLPNTNFARPSKNSRTNLVDNTLLFDADATGSDESAYWQKRIPIFYAGGNLTITICSLINDTNAAHLAELHFYCGSKSHDEVWDAALTEIGTVNINPTGTAYDLLVDTITWTSNLPTAGDMLILKVDVDNSDSTLAADLGILSITIEED